jgi:hypothetical protein
MLRIALANTVYITKATARAGGNAVLFLVFLVAVKIL